METPSVDTMRRANPEIPFRPHNRLAFKMRSRRRCELVFDLKLNLASPVGGRKFAGIHYPRDAGNPPVVRTQFDIHRPTLAILLAGLLLPGCTPKVPAPPKSERATAPATPSVDEPTAPAPPPPAPGSADGVTPSAVTAASEVGGVPPVKAEDLVSLTKKLRLYLSTLDSGRKVNGLQELVAAGYLDKLPTPPRGKHFDVDYQKKEVVLVND
jgi:hypothetical protein